MGNGDVARWSRRQIGRSVGRKVTTIYRREALALQWLPKIPQPRCFGDDKPKTISIL